MANTERSMLARHNVVASFVGAARARKTAEALRSRGVPDDKIVVGSGTDDAESMKAEMREEVDHSVVGPAVSVATPEMAKGAARWTLLGGAIGLVLGLVIGAIFFSATGMLVAAIAFAVGGVTAGFVAGGFSEPRPTEDARDRHSDARVTVGVHSDEIGDIKKAASFFEDAGADRIDRFDAEGNPLPELTDEDSG